MILNLGRVTNSKNHIVEAGYNVGEHIMLGDSQCVYNEYINSWNIIKVQK